MSVKDIIIKNRTYYVFNDIIYIENFDPNNIEIDEKSLKNILIFYIVYVTIKKDLKSYSVNLLCVIFGEMNRYFEVINGNRYLTLVPTNESKEKTKKYEEPLIKIRTLVRFITKNLDDYDEKYITIKFGSDDELPSNKRIEIPIMTIVVRAVFHENNKYYPHSFF